MKRGEEGKGGRERPKKTWVKRSCYESMWCYGRHGTEHREMWKKDSKSRLQTNVIRLWKKTKTALTVRSYLL